MIVPAGLSFGKGSAALLVAAGGEWLLMGHRDWVRALFVLGPIVGLLLLGLVVALRSGGAALANSEGLKQLASNVSQVLVATLACLIFLAALQRVVGFHFSLAW